MEGGDWVKNEQGYLEQILARKSIVKGSVTEALWLVLVGLKKAYEEWGSYSQFEGKGRGNWRKKDMCSES